MHLTADLPGIGGRIRERDEDFRVVEAPLYEPLGVGDHVYLRIEKSGIATLEAVRRLAGALGRRDRDIGYAGMKDARAVTEQTLSVEHVSESEAEAAVESVPDVRLVGLARHRNKLRLGHLAGNGFEIVVRGTAEDAALHAERVLAILRERGCPNWFGPQRFGERGDNHELGKRLVRGDRSAVLGKQRTVRRLLVSAYQSHLFNTLLGERLPDLGRLENGDLAWLHDRGAVFEVEDAAAEQPRADRLEVSPSGPLFGTRTTLAGGAPGERERALLAAEELVPADFDVRGAGSFRGARRPYRVPVPDASVEPVDATSVRLRFGLPPGSYATSVLAEVMKAPR